MLRIQNIWDFSRVMTRPELIEFIKTEIANETKVGAASINEHTSFHNLGLDSLSAILILHNIEKEYDVELNPIHFWDYPTPSAFADFMIQEHAK